MFGVEVMSLEKPEHDPASTQGGYHSVGRAAGSSLNTTSTPVMLAPALPLSPLPIRSDGLAHLSPTLQEGRLPLSTSPYQSLSLQNSPYTPDTTTIVRQVDVETGRIAINGYVIHEEVGRGVGSTVRRAMDPEGNPWAIKIVKRYARKKLPGALQSPTAQLANHDVSPMDEKIRRVSDTFLLPLNNNLGL